MFSTDTAGTQVNAVEVRARRVEWDEPVVLGVFSPSEIGPLVGLLKAGFYIAGYTNDDVKISATQFCATEDGAYFEIILDAD